MIHIKPYTESKVRIDTDFGVLQEISDAFKFRVDGYKFQPKFKMGIWDGYIRLLDMRSGLFPKGLIPDLLRWCNDREYDITVDKSIVAPFKEQIDFDWNSLNLEFPPRDFQEEAVTRCLVKKRQIILSSTGSGKSLIIYATIRALQEFVENKIVLIVPSVGLVEQMYSDFENYSKNSEWEVSKNVHKIYSGEDKNSRKKIFITTWQSMQHVDEEYLGQFDAVLFDEVHSCVGNVVGRIMDSCQNAFFRFGFTGTLQDSKTNEMQLKALFGPIHRVSSTKDLMDQKILAELKIKNIILKHTDEEILEMAKKFSYQNEMDYLVRCEKRNQFVSKLVSTRTSNTLVLFQYVEKQGKVLYEIIKQKCGNEWNVQFIYGGTETEQRESARKIMERTNPGTILNFGKFCLKIPFGVDVELECGKILKSDEITSDSDVSERWIEINKEKYKY